MSARVHVCVPCRVLLGPRESCDLAPSHPVAALDTDQGCRQLADEVWSAPRVAPFTAPEARAALATGGAVALLGGALFHAAVWLAVPAVGVVVGARELWRRRPRQQTLPRGIGAYPNLPHWRRAHRSGVAEGKPRLVAPFTGRTCVAWAVLFRNHDAFGGDIMLADAEASEFGIRGDAGDLVMVSPGRVRCDGASMPISDAAAIETYLARFAPGLRAGERSALPFTRVSETIVVPGDRITAAGKVAEVALSYREPGGAARFRTVPRLQLVTG